jgi:hypothetical protein
MNPIKPDEAKDLNRNINYAEIEERIGKINKILSNHDWNQRDNCPILEEDFGKGKVKYLLILKYQEHGWKVRHVPGREGHYELT